MTLRLRHRVLPPYRRIGFIGPVPNRSCSFAFFASFQFQRRRKKTNFHRLRKLRSSGPFAPFISYPCCQSNWDTAVYTLDPMDESAIKSKRPRIQRRESIPQELEDPEDCTVGEAPAQDDDDVVSTEPSPSFSFNNSFRSNICSLPKEIRNIIGGGIAGMVAKSVVAPADRIKILFQVSSVEFRLRNLPVVVGTIWREEGWTALWKGNTATMIRVIPYSGIQFMVFEKCKTHFLQQHDKGIYCFDQGISSKHGLTAIESLVSGMLAGSISVVCTYPLDLARAQLAVLKKKQNAVHSIGFLDIFRQNYGRCGITGLFRGLSITLAGMLPYAGIAFALNEQAKREVSFEYVSFCVCESD